MAQYTTFEDLQFENEQLYAHLEDTEKRLHDIISFLRQGITFHTNLVKLKNTPETRKFVEFLRDAISIVDGKQHIPVAQEVKPQVKLPQLKSLKSLPKSPRNKKPSPRRVLEIKEEDLDFKINLYNNRYRK